MLNDILKGISMPSPLSRERCQACMNDFAVVECRQCYKYYCKKCEIKVHTLKENPSKNPELSEKNALWHKNARISCNLCHKCHDAVANFYCTQCTSHQCKECCTTHHNTPEMMMKHSFFCVEGTKGNLLKFAVWSKEFIEMTQAKRRSMIVHPHASSEKENSRQRENEGIKAKQIPIAMVTFPSEPQQFQESKAEMKPNVSLVKNEPHFVSSLCSDIKPSNIVDLTQDDFDLDSTMETQSSPVPIYDTSTGSMENHHRLVVGNATDNTIDSTTDSTIDQKMIWTKFEFSMQDSIISSFMEEYNRLNTWIEDSKTMLLQASKQIKDFIAQGKVAQALEFGMKIEQIKKEMSKNKTQRDMILVHLILYTCHQINQQETMAKQLKKWKGLDLQYVQEASHRKCFHLEKEIQFKQKEIVKKRLQMEETIVMKKFSFEEMVFLNQLVQEEEKHIQQMEQQRTKEILKVFEFSQFIRSLVQKQLS